MNEIEFADKYLGQYKKIRNRNGEELVFKTCPFCGGGQHHDVDTFAINIEKHTYNCLRGKCAERGTFKELAEKYGEQADYYLEWLKENNMEYKKSNQEIKNYTPPKLILENINNDIVSYYKNRGISKEVVEKYTFAAKYNNKIFSVFKFDYNGKHVMNKLRDINYKKGSKYPKEICEKDGLLVLWNIDNIDLEKPVVITEGMIDALSVIESGYENTVSVPSGTNAFGWIDNCWNTIQKVKQWYIYVDNDEAGEKLKQELILKLGEDKCTIVSHDLKDANDEIKAYGKEIVKSFIDKAIKKSINGVVNISDVKCIDLNKIEKVKTGLSFLDKGLGGFLFPALNVWTGKRGSGKSTLLYQSLLSCFESNKNVFVYSGELSNSLFKLWIYCQIATEKHLNKTFDEVIQDYDYRPNQEAIKAIDKYLDKKLWLYDDKEVNKEDALIEKMQQCYERYDCRVFVIDNLTTLKFNPNKGGKYEAQSDFTDRLRNFAIKNNVNINLVVHPRKSQGRNKQFDNDDVGGTGDITNLAYAVINVKRIESPDDLTEKDIENLRKIRMETVNGIAEVTKNRIYSKTNFRNYFQFNFKSKRFYSLSVNQNLSWEKYLPIGYEDSLGNKYKKVEEKAPWED